MENDINRLSLQFKKYLTNKMKSIMIFMTILNKEMEDYFATVFEDIRHERSLFLLLSLRDPDILKQSKFTDHEMEIIKKLALEKLHRQRVLKEYVAMSSLKSQLD